MSTDTALTAPTRFVEGDGVRFAYRRWGKPGGAPLVFMQYFSGNLDDWDPDRFLLTAFFSPTDASQAAGRAYLNRLAARTHDRDLPVSKTTAEAQLRAIRDRGVVPSSNRYATLQNIKHPTLIVHGTKDIVVLPINAFILAERLPDAQLIMYPDSNHGAQYQHAELFLKHARLFLSA